VAEKMSWAQAVFIPPASGSIDVGQVGVPVTVQLRGAKGDVLVVSTSALVAVAPAYDNAARPVQGPARMWLSLGTWSMQLPSDLLQLVLTPPAVPFPGVPEVSVWIVQNPNDGC